MHINDPFDVFIKEHEEGEHYLQQLHNAATYISHNGFSFDAFMKLGESIRFLDNELRAHNEREEKYLFPLLERHVGNPVRVMLEEHRELWKLFARIKQCVEDIEEGRIYATTVKELVQASEQLYELLMNHIRKENEELFPMAKTKLTTEEFETLKESLLGVSSTSVG
jgi:hemerythrin-like domain-containing protein